jgi:outer membrane protein TolC
LTAAYQNRVLMAAQEVQSALRGFLDSQKQADALSGSATDAAAAARIGEDLFNKVKAEVNRLFTLENTRLQTQDQLAVAQGNIALNLISVYRALGGGWELRTQIEPCGAGPTRSETCAAPVEAPALANGAPASSAERLPGPVVPSK